MNMAAFPFIKAPTGMRVTYSGPELLATGRKETPEDEKSG